MDINQYLNSEEFKRLDKVVKEWYDSTTKPIVDRINEKYDTPSAANIKAVTYVQKQKEQWQQWEEFHKNKTNEKT